MASPRLDPSWSRLPSGTEIPELRTSTSHTYSNGDGTFRADITPMLTGGTDSQDSCQPTSSGWVLQGWENQGHYYYYDRGGPELRYQVGNPGTVACAKFDLSPIPDSSSIVSAQLHCYQYAVVDPPVSTRCTHLGNVDPDTASDSAVYWAVTSGAYLAQTQCDTTGWVTYDVLPYWLPFLQKLLPEDWVALGISPVAGEGSAFGICGDNRQACLSILYVRPDQPDIEALRAELLTYPVIPKGSDTALLTLTNKGLHSSGPFWAYASSGLARESAVVGAIAVGETTSVRIPLPSPTAPDAVTDYCLWAAEYYDGIRCNDSTRLRCWSFPASTYAAESFDEPDFPPPGWSVVDSDFGTHRWARQSASGRSHSGSGFAYCVGESTGNSDDWLISGSICPDRDYRDSVGFFIRNDVPLITYNLEVWVLSGRHAPVSLLSLSLGDTAYSRNSVSLDTFDGDTVKVAFRHRSWGDWRGPCLDDIWFGRIYAPDTSEPRRDGVRRTATQLPGLAFVPNPASGRVATVQCAVAMGDRQRLTIHNVLGRAMRTVALDPSGVTELDLRNFATGVYFAALNTGSQSVSRKLVITTR
jgi:hypothetical protein